MGRKPGDLIEIFRGGHSCWAVYVGGGNVVYFVITEYYPSPSGLAGNAVGGGKVLKKNLEDVVEKDRWRVNNFLDHKYRPGPADDMVKKACSLVDTDLQYDLGDYNCDRFATEMRYGLRVGR
ncbi:phospholipase A and acyltransferase 4-like [Cololabis saira]|uniref:phospholipase A and acyltransferase 4-like n=1 Tax=Cololabis saira TaxID=129043 RepID=UPI002AD28A73|nr:phospholipase A and acyltransferase 4-like [Cololabis saira]